MLSQVCLLALVAALGSAATIPKTQEQQFPLSTQPVVPMQCTDENTYGVFGCNQTYYQCAHGSAVMKQCPSKLYFDIAGIECKLHFQVSACSNPPSGDVLGFEINNDDLPDCEGDEEFVSNGDSCSRFYGHCTNGQAVRKFCPYNQVWVQADQTCNNIERVEACKSAKKKKIRGSKIQGDYSYGQPQAPQQTGDLVQPQPVLPQAPAQQVVIQPAAPQSGYSAPGYAPQAKPQQLVQDPQREGWGAVESGKSEFDCTQKQDGIYLPDQKACVNTFYKCSNFRTFKYTCPTNLWYDYEENMCNYKEFVPTCGGIRQPPTTPSPPRDVPKTNFDCTGKPDNSIHVEVECGPSWITCLGGIATIQSCTHNLVFDKRTSSCDYLAACQKPLPQPKPGMDFAHGGSQPSGPYSQPAQPVAPVINFKCQGKADGFYETGKCVNQYAACNNGIATGQVCPSNLVFDGLLKQCDFQQTCMSPKQPQPQIPQTPAQPQAGPYQQPAPLPQTPSQPQPVPQPLPQPKQYNYQQPAPQAPTQPQPQPQPLPQPRPQPQPQPQPQYQSYQYQTPAPPKPQPLPQLPAQPTAQPYGQTVQAPLQQQQPQQPLSSVNCANLQNGAYPVGKCNSNYVTCWNKAAAPNSCPNGLVFNSFNGQCDYTINVPDCPDFQAPIQQQDQPVTVPPTPADPFCNTRPDGSYSNGCSNTYYVCHAAKTHKMACHVGLFFDVDTNTCQFKDQVALCGGSPAQPAQQQPAGPYSQPQPQQPLPQQPPVKTQTYIQPQPQPQPLPQQPAQPQPQQPLPQQPQPQTYTQPRPQPQPLPQQPVPLQPLPQQPLPQPTQNGGYNQPQTLPAQDSTLPAGISCAGKPDGIYGLTGCTPQFYQCYRGNPKMNKCLDSLFYNVMNGMCDFKERVPACGGLLPSPTPSTPTIAPKPAQSQPTFSCQGKQDGYYNQGCSNWYWACVSGVAIQHQCNGMNLFFSAQTIRCDLKQWVPECGGKIQPKIQPSPQPQQPSLPAQAPAQAAQSCMGKLDGLYTMGACSMDYLSCFQGQGIVSSCSSNLIFNQATGGCDYVNNVAGCGKSTPQQDMPQPQPQPQPQQPQPQPKIPSFDCSNKADGYWATSKCSEFYVLCQMGRAIQELPCQVGLAFSNTLQQCEYKLTLNECNPLAPPLQQPQQPILKPIPQPQPQPQPLPARDTTNLCAQKMNGLYSTGCSSQYIMCTNFQTTPLFCPSTLVFDSSINQCNYPNLVSTCQSAPLPQSQPVIQPQPMIQPQPQQPIAQPMLFPQQQQPMAGPYGRK
ncbi:unnamed protein product, partial [Mesorhabditis belari]|uniref:Chitin-binding type-2 domain-containing protein n=1 Tax=Mesorhabditis belari TaxID=2138241 RepID=A0AAF3ETN3_9BILA